VFLVGNPSTGRLEIMSLPDQDSELLHSKTGLLCCDVWEHDERLHNFMRETSQLQQSPRRIAHANQ
jgi:Iron/manganese superoxide dismutases, C-terminal domain